MKLAFVFYFWIVGIEASSVKVLLLKEESNDCNLQLFSKINSRYFYWVNNDYVNFIGSGNLEDDIPITFAGSSGKTEGTQFPLGAPSKNPWHLSRIVQKNFTHTQPYPPYPYHDTGSCHTNPNLLINTYIIDTGIDRNHPQFESRASWGENFVDNIDTDCNGHGTHVAGIIGSRDYGVCVDAKMFAVKVLDCEGSGSLSGVIRGLEWVYNQHLNATSNKTVITIVNLSLGGSRSRLLNEAVEACLENNPNFHIVVAAGNENNDACNTSPASARGVISVMASDKNDFRASFSNYGKCGTLYAPGVDILSTIPDGKIAKLSGTSMASPVVAGVLNHYINNNKSVSHFINQSTQNVIRNNKKNTLNLFVYLQ